MPLYKAFAALCVALASVQVTTACSCFFESVEQQYCGSEWVFSFKVTADGVLEDDNLVYPIDVLKMNKYPNFQLTPPEYPTHAQLIGNPFNSCYMTLTPGVYYIASGRLVSLEDGSNRVGIGPCGYLRAFREVQELRKYKLPNCRKYFKLQDREDEAKTDNVPQEPEK